VHQGLRIKNEASWSS